MERQRRRSVGAVNRRAVNQEGTVKMLFNMMRFFRERRTYWSVVQELSTYTNRELHDIGIDRADIHAIARLAAKEATA